MQKDPHSEHAAVNSKVSLRLPILLNPRISDRCPTVAPDMQQIKGQPEHLGLPKKRGIAPNLWPSNTWENHLHEKENEFLHHQILGRLIVKPICLNGTGQRNGCVHHPGAPLTHIEVLALRAVGQNTGDIVRHPFQVPPASRAQGSPLADSNRDALNARKLSSWFLDRSYKPNGNLKRVVWAKNPGLLQSPS